MGAESQARRMRRVVKIMRAMKLEPSVENFSWARRLEAWEREMGVRPGDEGVSTYPKEQA